MISTTGHSMRLNFLCEHHRRSLMASPDAAGEHWRDCLDRLAELSVAPTPYRVNIAGSALEAAGIYLIAQRVCDAVEINRYVRTVICLLDVLRQLSQDRLVLVVVAGANATLEYLAENGSDRFVVVRGRRRLKIEGMRCLDQDAPSVRPTSPESLYRRATLH